MAFIKTTSGALINVDKIGAITLNGNSIAFYQDAITTRNIEPSGFIYQDTEANNRLTELVYKELVKQVGEGRYFIEMEGIVEKAWHRHTGLPSYRGVAGSGG